MQFYAILRMSILSHFNSIHNKEAIRHVVHEILPSIFLFSADPLVATIVTILATKIDRYHHL